MVLHRKLEVRQRDGDKGRHDEQDDEHDEEDGVNGVHLGRHTADARIAQSAERETLSDVARDSEYQTLIVVP